MNTIELSNFEVSNSSKLAVIAGLNVLETEEPAIEVANTLKKVTTEFGNPLIFKASFDKANRSSVDSYRGPGLKKGLEILKNLKVVDPAMVIYTHNKTLKTMKIFYTFGT